MYTILCAGSRAAPDRCSPGGSSDYGHQFSPVTGDERRAATIGSEGAEHGPASDGDLGPGESTGGRSASGEGLIDPPIPNRSGTRILIRVETCPYCRSTAQQLGLSTVAHTEILA